MISWQLGSMASRLVEDIVYISIYKYTITNQADKAVYDLLWLKTAVHVVHYYDCLSVCCTGRSTKRIPRLVSVYRLSHHGSRMFLFQDF